MPGPGDLDTVSTEFIDLDQAHVLKQPRDLTKHLLDRAGADAYQRGEVAVENQDPGRSKLERIAGTAPESVGGPEFTPAPPQPVPVAQPQQVPVAQPQEALVSNQPVPQPPPVQATDSQRVQDRIHRLYGQMRTAQEERDVYAERINQLEQRLSQLSQPAAQEQPTYQFEGPPAPASQPSAGQYVSRTELNAMFGQLTQAIQRRDALASSQIASRATVERDFAQDLSDPTFRQTFESVLQQDRTLREDPNGPEKAAVMARGLLAGYRPNTSTLDVARRQAMSPGIGPTVPEGGSAPVADQVSRYNQAIARARTTGRDEDFVQALLIQRGQA